MSEWHYLKDDKQLGPVSADQLKRLAASGHLQPQDMVWRDGMSDWSPAAKVPGLFATEPAAAATAPAAAIPPNEIGYYSPTAGLNARAAKTLKGFPTARGPKDEWPLTDRHLADLAHAEKQRKILRNFNSLCSLFTLGSAVAAVVNLIGFTAGAPARGGPMGMAPLAAVATLVAVTFLYFFAGRAALKCQIWAPITVTALLAIGILSSLGSMFFAVSAAPAGPGSAPPIALVAPVLFLVVIGGLFLYMSARAIFAIPRFLASPLWAQEALVNAKL